MNDDLRMISINEAHDASVEFLREYYDETSAEDIAILFGEMFFCGEKPLDPVAQQEWLDSAKRVLYKDEKCSSIKDFISKKLSIYQAYQVLIDYLKRFRDRMDSADVSHLLDGMTLLPHGESVNTALWQLWLDAVRRILQQSPRKRPQWLSIQQGEPVRKSDSEIVLICKPLEFYGQNDENIFFEWIKRISCVDRYEGVGLALYLYVSSKRISDGDLRELIGLFKRYGHDREQLRVFMNNENKELFDN